MGTYIQDYWAFYSCFLENREMAITHSFFYTKTFRFFFPFFFASTSIKAKREKATGTKRKKKGKESQSMSKWRKDDESQVDEAFISFLVSSSSIYIYIYFSFSSLFMMGGIILGFIRFDQQSALCLYYMWYILHIEFFVFFFSFLWCVCRTILFSRRGLDAGKVISFWFDREKKKKTSNENISPTISPPFFLNWPTHPSIIIFSV